MRYWRFTLPLLLVFSPLALCQQQYTEGTCILLQQQIDRFSAQPQSRNYIDSKREFANHCQNPIPATGGDVVLTNIPAKPAVLTNSSPTAAIRPVAGLPAKPVAAPKPVVANSADAMQQLLNSVLKMLAILFGILLAIVLARVILVKIFGITDASIKGALAERQLHRLLVSNLAGEYQHYRNLILETAQGDLTEIDHLVLSPFGIFVIEVKNYKGWIFGSEHQPKWTLQHFKSKHSFQNPLHQNNKHIGAVKFALGLSLHDSKLVQSIVAFSERAEFRTQLPVQVCHIRQVAAHIQQFSQPWFSDEQLRQFTARLNMAADSRKVLSKLHMQQFDA